MPNVVLSPWKGGTPRRLANGIGAYLRTPGQLRIKPMKNIGTLVSWGCFCTDIHADRVLNTPAAVATAASKLSSFRILKDAQIPTLEFTTEPDCAKGWLKSASVFAHTNPHAHSAQGLVLVKRGAQELPTARVYTRYFPKRTESRTHVIRTPGGVYSIYLEKRRVTKERYEEFGITESPTTFIRTYANGWIFAREVETDPKAVELAIRTIELLKLHYGAVDILRDKSGNYVVGEINTAPGLEGQALEFYVTHLRRMI